VPHIQDNFMQVFINKFQKGSQENQNLGTGAIVGFDTYSKKNVLRLAKKSTIVTSSGGANITTTYPTFIDLSQSGNYIWTQMSDGAVIYSSDGGITWQPTNSAFPVAGHGNGMIFFQNYMFAFTDDKLYYWLDTATGHGNDPTAGAWVQWKTGLQQFSTDPITSLHFPFLYPNNRGVYFGNGTFVTAGDCTLGFFGQVGTTLFNPAGAAGVDYLYNGAILNLPSYTYTIGSINFLPPNSLALAVNQWQNPSQGSDLITWDTVSANKFTPPLRIFSNINSTDTATVTAGLKQLTNRNQVLYAVTGGNHSIYETNGSSFNLLEDIALYSSIRNYTDIPNGGEDDSPVFFNSFPSAINVLGNKLLTGVAPMANSSTYPTTNNGFFPVGVWSIAFDNTGGHSTQCEFIVPIGSDVISPSGSGNYMRITAIKPISIDTASSSTGQFLIGFSFKSSGQTLGGFSIVDLFKYVDNINYVSLESELFEVGTYLSPKQIGNIEINFVKKLKTNQTFDLAYRIGIENDWTFIPYEGNNTVTGDNTKNSYSYTSNAIGAVQYVQFRFRMATDSGNATNSPELRTIIINPLQNNG